MIITSDYSIVQKGDIYYVISNTLPICPECYSLLKLRDSKKRQLILDNGERRVFQLKRFRCADCGHLHIELPNIMLPNKHYAKYVINETVTGVRKDCPADNSTILRWAQEMGGEKI